MVGNRKLHRTIVPTLCTLVGLGLATGNSLLGQTSSKSESAKTTVANRQQSKTSFLRMQRTAQGEPQSLQTAITRYRPAKGELVVDLVGAVHIGEADYYRQLNRQFDLYDVVLYELVAEPGTRVPRGGKRSQGLPSSPMDLVGWMQGQAQSRLGLSSQLEMIDYQKSNFTHADLSPSQMSQKMAERGDTALTIGLSAFSEMLRQQNRLIEQSKAKGTSFAQSMTTTSMFELLDNPLKLKQLMASQFTETGVMENGLGKSLNQLLVVDRNKAAIDVLQKQIVQGKQKIAIFYGAAHMPDFEQRLVKSFGLERTKQVWVDAWDLTNAPKSQPDNTTKMLMNLLNELAK